MLNGRKSMNGSLARRASIHVAFCHVDEVGLGEEAFLPGCRGEWLGNIRTDVVQIACTYLWPAEVTRSATTFSFDLPIASFAAIAILLSCP